MADRYKIAIVPRELHFKIPAGTSRGVYRTRRSWYVLLTDRQTGERGVGECAPLPQLSTDEHPNYEQLLRNVCDVVEHQGFVDTEALRAYPSILFGLETAERHLSAGSIRFFDTPFARGKEGIRINGLIWMGTYEEMYRQIRIKLEAGFTCLKLKIGAIDFEEEIKLLHYIRRQFSADDLELRVDANGAFSPSDVREKLLRLSDYTVHSIEQPIKAGQWQEMAKLCAYSPIPIALDEELIPVIERAEKERLLRILAPQYIILKPSLHGGMAGCDEWIALAEQCGVGYWATSALESNVGLNAIAQWTAQKSLSLPQGLGTGQLFTDNIPYPLSIQGEYLWMNATTEEPDIHTWLGV